MKEGGGGEGHWGCYYATALDIEVDPQRRRFVCRRESAGDFALQRLSVDFGVCVFIPLLLLQYLLQSCSRWGRRVEDMCYERRRAGALVD